jgi:hypothetical protein
MIFQNLDARWQLRSRLSSRTRKQATSGWVRYALYSNYSSVGLTNSFFLKKSYGTTQTSYVTKETDDESTRQY